MRPTPDFWITRIDEADARGSRARDRETIEIEYPSAARGRRRLVGDELLADDFVDSARGTRQGLCRTSAVRSGNARNVSSRQSSARCFDMVAEDDLVATYKTFTGTHAGTFMGIPATGRRASFDAFDLMRLRDGKVVDHWVVFDGAGLMRQLGVLPPTRPEG